MAKSAQVKKCAGKKFKEVKTIRKRQQPKPIVFKRRETPWTEIVPIAKVSIAARQVYHQTGGFGFDTIKPKESLHIPNGSVRKDQIIKKIIDSFKDPLTKVNKSLLHKYKCPNCKKCLNVCYKSRVARDQDENIVTSEHLINCQNQICKKLELQLD